MHEDFCVVYIETFIFICCVLPFPHHHPPQAGRQFAVDMAGFAVNLLLLHRNPGATIPLQVGGNWGSYACPGAEVGEANCQ